METKNLIPEGNLARVGKEIAKLNRKAVKLGVAPMIFEVTGKFEDKKITGPNDNEYLVRFCEVRISGDSPVLAGWNFLAQLDHDNGYNIVNNLSGKSLSGEYGTVAANCDHCKIDRQRNKTYIVENIKSRVRKQVGSTCVKDFTGHKSPEKVLAIYSNFFRLISDAAECNGEYLSTGGEYRQNTADFVRMAVAVILKDGFRPAASDQSTKDVVFYHLYPPKGVYGELVVLEARNLLAQPDVNRFTAFMLMDFVDELDAKKSLNDFEFNLKNILSDETFKPRYGSYLAAGVNSAIKSFIKRKEVVAKSNEFIGDPANGRETFDLNFIRQSTFESQFGMSTRYVFEDVKGNSVVLFSTSDFELETARTYKVVARVKKHNIYEGRKQTIITRVKIN